MATPIAISPATGKPCIKISWSGLKRWEDCPQRHLRNVRRETRPVNGRVFLAGNVVDSAERQWLNEGARPGELVRLIPEWMDRMCDPSSEASEYTIRWNGNARADRAAVLEKCVLAAQRLEPILLEHVAPYQFEPEKKFEVWVGIPGLNGERVGILLTGGIDIVVRDDEGNFRLYDLKTTENRGYIRSTAAQAIFYDIAWGHWWGDHTQPREFGFIAPLLSEKLIPVAVNDDHRRVMMQRIIKAAHGMMRDQWSPKRDNEGCSWCEAKAWCPKFALAHAKDAFGKNRVNFAETARRRAEAVDEPEA